MKKALAIAGVLALSITPTASFADHLELKERETRQGGNLFHKNQSCANLSGTILSGITAKNLGVCPISLPSGCVCENNSLVQR